MGADSFDQVDQQASSCRAEALSWSSKSPAAWRWGTHGTQEARARRSCSMQGWLVVPVADISGS